MSGKRGQAPAPLDVAVVIDAFPSSLEADPTGEGLRAVEAMLGGLEPGDTVRLRVGNALIIEFSRSIGFGTDIRDETVPIGEGLQKQWLQKTLGDIAGSWELPPELGNIDASNFFDGAVMEELLGRSFDWTINPHGLLLDEDGDPRREEQADPCRGRALILITDGSLEPDGSSYEPGYVPVMERTSTPVHVLDVGSGDRPWLREIAATSRGTYVHVPTSGQGFLDRNIEPPGTDPEGEDATDSDGDGVPDVVELTGAWPVFGSGVPMRLFTSDPHSPDTDGDGLPDGTEYGDPVLQGPGGAWAKRVYAIVSDPASWDSDGDFLGDLDEVESDLRPFDADPDRDGLDDWSEVDWGTDPFNPDTDADQIDDRTEVDGESQGYDPHTPNITVETEWWLAQFSLGMFCGDVDACRRSSVAWLAGNLASGIAVFGDVRDAVWQVSEGEWLIASFTAVGIVPGIGDLAGSSAKIGKWFARASGIEADAARKLIGDYANPGDFVALLRKVEPQLVVRLEVHGASVARIADIVRHNSKAHIEALFASPRLVAASSVGFDPPPALMGWPEAEDFVRSGLEASGEVLGSRQEWSKVYGRVPDAVTITGGSKTLHEVKSGSVRGRRIRKQFRNDMRLLDDGKVGTVTWHFFQSDISGKLGPTRYCLQQLEAIAATYGQSFSIVVHLAP